MPERELDRPRRTISGIELNPSYNGADLPGDFDHSQSPGKPPFARGGFELGYRSKLWRIFQLSGFGNPEDEGERIRYLLEKGETGYIMEHDRMTADHLYDVDHPDVSARSEDVGLSGAVILSVHDFLLVLDGIDIGAYFAHPGGAVPQHAPFALAGFWTAAQRRGFDISKLIGTGQSDFFLTYVGCPPKEQIPASAALRLNVDIVEFCAAHVPRWVPVSIAGYNGADSGLNAYQELAAVMSCAVAQIDAVVARGNLPPAQVAHYLSGVNFRVSMDLMEDIAKLRTARKMWHDLLTRRYGITDERALRMRIHVVTAGSAMTYQEPMNNIVRGTLMALASMLGGVQSLGVSGYDEALSIPSETAHHMSVRIQQILQEETGLTAVADPLGGSYYLEALGAELEGRAWEFFEAMENQGGFISCLDSGWIHEIAGANQIAIEEQLLTGERRRVGVDVHRIEADPFEVDGFSGVDDVYERAVERLAKLRRSRSAAAVGGALRELDVACREGNNVMPPMMEALAAEVSLGEVGAVFRGAFGQWDSPIDLV